MSASQPPAPDGRAELARGLQRHLERRARMGIRRFGPGPADSGPNSGPRMAAGAIASGPAPAHPAAKVQTPAPPRQTVAATPGARRIVPGKPEPQVAEAPQPHPIPPDSKALSSPDPGAPGTETPALRAPLCTDLRQLAETVAQCQACELCQTRQQTVFADGSPEPGGVFFIGEAPGAEEDRTGVPFVGPAGQLLTDIIEKGMGLSRRSVFIANVLKCRPPGNRDPLPGEKALCTPYLDRQIELVQPKVLIPLGAHAAQHVLGVDQPISALRGRVHEHRGRSVVPTFHPAYLLRNPSAKKDCWQDIQLAMQVAGIPRPGR